VAQPDPLTMLTQTDADFTAWYARWEAKRDVASARYNAACDRLDVDAKLGHIITEREEAHLDWQMLDSQLFAEIAFRHFPGLAPALRLAREHALEQYTAEAATCCSDAAEPW
jgi:hypothetical protein